VGLVRGVGDRTSGLTGAGSGLSPAGADRYHRRMLDMLARTAHLPEIEVAAGDPVVTEGGVSGEVYVLVSGSLTVRKGDQQVNTITRPGAVIGEISVLLDTVHGATVVAAEPSVLRVADDGKAFLGEDPDLLRSVAVGLAERLNFVTTYLADLKDQYGDAPGISMVSEVLSTLGHHGQPAATPGSARDPDPTY
jgi:CRP/FNR family cyclic AMP-dependent transcriptional regulator